MARQENQPLYADNRSLLTDLYQLTMAYGYWKEQMADRHAIFHLFFRKCPFGGEYAIAAGLEDAVRFIDGFGYDDADLQFLASLTGANEQPLFEAGFLEYLGNLKLEVDIDAMPEGTLAFPNEPLIRIRGPLLQAQLLETPLLAITNFATLIATKSARICREAGDGTVLEFGLRRAHATDGGISASRAAYIGGCHATSNVLAGKLFGIPVKGTHAHSWIMSFPTEEEAFQAYADAMPANCVFLVDTYDTLEGVKRAIEVGKKLKAKGYPLLGVRLDSGDLHELSIATRNLLDDAGFPEAKIVASNDLDEYLIRDLKQQGAKIDIWGVGTRLATAYDQPALGGVYKLAAIQDESGEWLPKVKLSEQAIKTSIPGCLNVMRFQHEGRLVGDAIFNEFDPPTEDDSENAGVTAVTPLRQKKFVKASGEAVLQPIYRGGKRVYELPSIHDIRERAIQQRDSLSNATSRLQNPTPYFVGLEESLNHLRQELIEEAGVGEEV